MAVIYTLLCWPLRYFCFWSAAFIICTTWNVTGSVSESLIQSGTRCFSFISIAFRLLVLSSSHRSTMRSEHAVLLFTKMTANLTFSCQSSAYMIFLLPLVLGSFYNFFSPFLKWHPFFPWCLTPPLILLKPFIKSELSALTMPLLLPVSSPFFLLLLFF